ncbi:4'-phosphopantetheinyl transferase family protein [Streptomyces californicus]|uniref:4'-phosphopantetheinyl transferase family protein n=1 Tax=Streptomyces californicus TaxID=67351 RepID=UPI0036937F70
MRPFADLPPPRPEATGMPRLAPPVHVGGPDGPWNQLHRQWEESGGVVVLATWGEWLPAVVTDPRLRGVLGDDWPRYRRTADATVRHRFAAARFVLKHAAAAALETDPAELDLAYRPGGRPYLRGVRGVDVSLAHTGELVVAGLSRTGRIGVDAEPLTRSLSVDVLLARACTPDERAAVKTLGGIGGAAGVTAALLRLWTLKEAYTKALGCGLRLPFARFGVPWTVEGEATAYGDEGLLSPGGGPAGPRAWTFGAHRALDRYLVGVARHDGAPAASLRPSSDRP